jgi:hypothetical protein
VSFGNTPDYERTHGKWTEVYVTTITITFQVLKKVVFLDVRTDVRPKSPGATSQKTASFIATAVKTSNLTFFRALTFDSFKYANKVTRFHVESEMFIFRED